ncbi:hypothetical protein [Bacteroides reticulotermitis]|uniref:Uncharacterized protein n=1 Tax=Bacteroides reticulotermitis TaxID=1133319 RepID=A0A840D5S2_9BACE|nr:hypothetical protein [Bacteroides reticulotermitis]MBB4045808.1 hypothetical protein [Bacteroides reticulotermitis]
MKLQFIANICKSAVTLLITTGIFLLCLKGIVPVHTIFLLFVAGGIIRFLIQIISTFMTILFILIVIGMLV